MEFASVLSTYQQRLTTAPHSPGDPFIWHIHGELVQICRRVFGSPTTGSGYLSNIRPSSQEMHMLLNLLHPSSAFMQYLIKSAAEQITLEVTFDILHPYMQRLPVDYLPAVFKDRATTRQSTITGSTPNTMSTGASNNNSQIFSNENQKFIRCNLIEFYLLYFVYYGSLPTSSDSIFGSIRKAVSLISSTVGLTSSIPPVQQSPYLASIGPNSPFTQLFKLYIDYFLPWKKTPVFGGLQNRSASSILDSPYISRTQQINISLFFLEIICEFWIGQDYYTSPDPLNVSFNPPTLDLLNLILAVEESIQSMNIPTALSFANKKGGSFEELSIYNPLDYLQCDYSASFRTFSSYFYRALRVYFNYPATVPMDQLSKMLKQWLCPNLMQSELRIYIFNNLLFYTVLFDQYLEALTNRLPLNSIVLQLTNGRTVSNGNNFILSESNINDLLTLKYILSKAYTDINVFTIEFGELALVSMHQEVQLPQEMHEELAFYSPTIQQSFIESESQIRPQYQQVMGSLSGGGGKLLKRLYHLEIFIERIEILQLQQKTKSHTSFWKSFIDQELPPQTPKNTHEQLELIRSCVDLLEIPFSGHEELKKQWRFEAKNLVEEATANEEKLKNDDLIYRHPETRDSKLTLRGKQQILSGEQKCSSRDLKMPPWNPRNLKIVTVNEIELLVRLTVWLGLHLDHCWIAFVDKIGKQLGVTPWQVFYQVEFCYLRWFANKNNLYFSIALYTIFWTVKQIYFIIN